MKYPKYRLAFPGKHIWVFNEHPMTQFNGYKLNTTAIGNGVVSADKTKGYYGESATLFVSAGPDYTYSGMEVDVGHLSGSTYVFGRGDAILSAYFKASTTRYVVLQQSTGGTITAIPMTGVFDDEITLSSNSNQHYTFNNYSITGATLSGNKFRFGNSDVTAKGNWVQDPIYTATLVQNVGGRISAVPLTGFSGDTITLSNTPSSHYTFNGYSITGGVATGNNVRFGNSNLTIAGNFVQDPVRTLIIQQSEGGTIGANKMSGYDNDVVTLSNTANTGYEFSNYSLTGATLTSNQFKFNGNNVTAKGVFNQTVDPYNPLNLPFGTVRVKTNGKNGKVPIGSYQSYVVVDSANNIYDCYKPSFNGMFAVTGSDANIIEVLGANSYDQTNMDNMFYRSFKLSSVALFDTYNVTSMTGMFWGATVLKTIPQFNTSKVTTMYKMFSDGYRLTGVPLLDTSNVTSMGGMFSDCWYLKSLPLFDTSKVTDMSYMCIRCEDLTAIPLFNTSKVTNMNNAFQSCIDVKTGALALYRQASTQATPPTGHSYTFSGCGRDSQTGSAEVAQIPSDWK